MHKHFFGHAPSPLVVAFLRGGKMHLDPFQKPPLCFFKHLNEGWRASHLIACQFHDQFLNFFNHTQYTTVSQSDYSKTSIRYTFAYIQFLNHEMSSSHLRYLIFSIISFFLVRHVSQPCCVSFLRYDKRETSLKIFS